MKEDLLPYYENELSFLRSMGVEFAKSWGKIAERLLLKPTGSDDPHVERLIEAFALLAGRVHHKIDDEFPEIAESLLGVLYPHYLRPIPSMLIAQFHLDPSQAQRPAGHPIGRGSELYTRPVGGMNTTCTFRTCFPVTLWPLEVVSAAVLPAAVMSRTPGSQGAYAALRIEMKCPGKMPFSALEIDRLRFFLNGESSIANTLYELVCNNVLLVSVTAAASSGAAGLRPGAGRQLTEIPLPPGCIQPAGFSRDEGMLPYPDRSFLGYRLLQEYFTFPPKFFFFDLLGLDRIPRENFGDRFSIVFYLSPFERKQRLQQLEQDVTADTFQLGCTPAVNLFDRLAEPVRLTHSAAEYRIVPDVHRQQSTEVYSVNKVTCTAPYLETPKEYAPFYSLRHAYHAYEDDPANAYWYARRRISEKKGDQGTEVYLSLVDLGFEPARPPDETLTVHVTCTNRDLAGELPLTGEFGELSMESGSMFSVRCLVTPTKTVRPPLRRGSQWRLISHLSLNYLSIVEGGRDALQEILKLYDFTGEPAIRKQITGIVNVTSGPHVARVISENGVVFAQGVRVGIEFDEEEFTGAGVFLLASVLERFLGLYNSINSFSQLTVRTKQRKEDLKRWPPRTGEQILL